MQAESIMSIKSISRALSISLCAGLLSSYAHAATITDRALGLDSLDKIVIDFGDDASLVGMTITDNFISSGVTFGTTYVYETIDHSTIPVRPSLTQGHLTNINIDGAQPGSIFFTSDVSAAVFSWRTDNNAIGNLRVETLLSAYNDNVLVEQFSGFSNKALPVDSGRYFGFEGIVFDEIRLSLLVEGTMDLSTKTYLTLDNLEYVSAIPIPATVWLFGSGLIGLIGFARRNR